MGFWSSKWLGEDRLKDVELSRNIAMHYLDCMAIFWQSFCVEESRSLKGFGLVGFCLLMVFRHF